MSYKTLLTKACEKFDLGFNSNITELDTYHYLPSKPFSNEKDIIKDLIPQYVANKVGIPSTGDYGYIISEMFDIMQKKFRTKLEVINGVVQLHNVDDPYWKKQSNFKPHIPLFFNTKKYNTEELKQTRMMTFLTDVNDSWTLENYTGTSYEIKTNSTTEGTIKGLDRIDIPMSLGSSKTKANIVEELVISMASIADAFAKVIGQDTNFQEGIEANRINVLKISSNEMSVPKAVPLIGGNMPKNHRDLLSAKFLMNTFHAGKSFVTGDQLGQKVIYDDFQQPFNLNDFLNVSKSGKFTMTDGREANFIDMEYNISKDVCDCSIYVEEVYTNKLTETTYEP